MGDPLTHDDTPPPPAWAHCFQPTHGSLICFDAQQDDKPIKLHATIVNTKYRKTSNQRQGQQAAVPIDARAMMETFGNVDLGVHPLPELHLSQRHKTGPDGYYLCLGSLPLKPA